MHDFRDKAKAFYFCNFPSQTHCIDVLKSSFWEYFDVVLRIYQLKV